MLDAEPLHVPISTELARRFGYGLYSARFGNIYTLRQLRQLIGEALGEFHPEATIWKHGERFYDALRPTVEAEGFSTEEEAIDARALHLEAVKKALQDADVLIFTLGLTESWEHIASGTVYPTAPETVAGQYDPRIFGFRNLTFQDCLDDYAQVKSLLAGFNPDLRILLTVSPVPLTATASGRHILTATTQSKAILRAAASEIIQSDLECDYFPSYELVTAPKSDGSNWFEPNLRSVSAEGVARVMKVFLRAHNLALEPNSDNLQPEAEADEPHCDELLLEAFAP